MPEFYMIFSGIIFFPDLAQMPPCPFPVSYASGPRFGDHRRPQNSKVYYEGRSKSFEPDYRPLDFWPKKCYWP